MKRFSSQLSARKHFRCRSICRVCVRANTTAGSRAFMRAGDDVARRAGSNAGAVPIAYLRQNERIRALTRIRIPAVTFSGRATSIVMMNNIYLCVAAATILLNAGAAIGDLLKAAPVLKTSAEVGVGPSWVPFLGALKGAGALGLLLGLLGVPLIGTAAAAGLVAFFVGAICFHVRARVFYNIAFPGFFLTLAAASLVLSLHARQY